MAWYQTSQIESRKFTCGYCGNVVATRQGYFYDGNQTQKIYICPHCEAASYFEGAKQTPGVTPGVEVGHLPEDIAVLYREARNAISVGSYTAAVLTCRKLLMNLAVGQGAKENLKFIEYVDFLADKGFVPPNGRGWVDHIRTKGNEATHEIVLMGQGDATDLLTFVEMLLKFIFEFPRRVPIKK